MAEYPAILDQLDRGPPVQITSVGGGCIADAGLARFEDGSCVFVKRVAGREDMFDCEAVGLRALREANAIRVPEVLTVSDEALVLEYIKAGHQKPGFFADFGRAFANLHRNTSRVCGFSSDNYLGSTPQSNSPVTGSWEDADETHGSDWGAFFMERRLRYQVELAAANGHGEQLTRLLDHAEPVILELIEPNCEPPSLLHGDLWGGNFMVDEAGNACLIDPAVYYGHREADLAMTRLFGGFDRDFYSAYEEEWPLPPGSEERLHIYQLYHVLNHLNLFGSAYYGRSKSILERYAR